MKTALIVAEFNPFHNGHKYIIEKAREMTGADYVVVLMSGDYVQRGAPAVIGRGVRTRMALSSGADLVISFPTRYATCSAEEYARHAVRIADELGCIDTLFFGSECGDIDALTETAKILAEEPDDYKRRLGEYLKSGCSFPKARALALPQCEEILSTPNNILGVEYIKAILRSKSKIVPATCKREGTEHADTSLTGRYASATAIRKCIKEKAGNQSQSSSRPDMGSDLRSWYAKSRYSIDTLALSVPENVFKMLKLEFEAGRLLFEDDLSFLLAQSLWQAASATDLTGYLSVTEQLANAIFAARQYCITFSDFAMLLKNKSLTYTHITRALLHIALGIRKDASVSDVAHVLGMKKSAGALISEMIFRSTIPVIAKPSDAFELPEASLKLFEEEIRISNIYNILMSQKCGQPIESELKRRLITI